MPIDLCDVIPFPNYVNTTAEPTQKEALFSGKKKDRIILSERYPIYNIGARRIEKSDRFYAGIIEIWRRFMRWIRGESEFKLGNGYYEIKNKGLIKRLKIDKEKFDKATTDEEKRALVIDRLFILELQQGNPSLYAAENEWITSIKNASEDVKFQKAQRLHFVDLQILIEKLKGMNKDSQIIARLNAMLLAHQEQNSHLHISKERVKEIIAASSEHILELNLRHLDLTVRDLKDIIEKCPHLKKIDVKDWLVFKKAVAGTKDDRILSIYKTYCFDTLKGTGPLSDEKPNLHMAKAMKKLFMETVTEKVETCEEIEEIDMASMSGLFDIDGLHSETTMIREDFLKVFSNTKKLIKLNLRRYRNAYGCLGQLPKRLQELRLDAGWVLQERDVKEFPKGLTHLSVAITGEPMARGDSDIKRFKPWSFTLFSDFRHLSSLELTDGAGVKQFFSHLPQSLKKLSYMTFAQSEGLTIEKFSEGLEELTFHGIKKESPVKFHPKVLPRSLKTLNFQFDPNVSLQDIVGDESTGWPAELTSLSIEKAGSITDDDMALLPPTVKTLTLKSIRIGLGKLTVFPLALTTLRLTGRSMQELIKDRDQILSSIREGLFVPPNDFEIVLDPGHSWTELDEISE